MAWLKLTKFAGKKCKILFSGKFRGLTIVNMQKNKQDPRQFDFSQCQLSEGKQINLFQSEVIKID